MISLFPSRTIALEFFGFPIRWYGLLYLAGFLLAWWLLPRLQRYRGLTLTREAWERLLGFSVLGVILGGRLGFVLFYEPMYFFAHPANIFAVWEGGMASHGGFLGVVIALLLALRQQKIDLLKLADVVVIPAALGLAIGRLGNLINQELYGTVTTLPWGLAIPGVEGLRHPAPLYDALYNLLIAGLCFWHLTRPRYTPGRTAALFLILYGVFRFFIEFLRVQDYAPLSLWGVLLTRGQLLTLPFFFFGVFLWWWCSKRRLISGMSSGAVDMVRTE